MQTDILKGLDETTNELLQAISLFTQEQFNTVPFKNSWTAAQVAEHILKSESGLPALLKGGTLVTERSPAEKATAIESLFLDMNTKMQSPPFILPSNNIKEKETLSGALKANRNEIKIIAPATDLTLTLTDFSFPGFGELTGIEWLTFIICHSKRHTIQLQNIYKSFV